MEVQQAAAPLVLAVVAGLLAGAVDQVGAQAVEVGRGIQDRVVPARIAHQSGDAGRARQPVAEVGVEHRRGEGVGVDEGVEEDGGDEVRRGIAAKLDGAPGIGGQADEGIAGEEVVAVEAAGAAGVRAEEGFEREEALEAVAEVFAAFEAPVGGGHAAGVDHPGAAGVEAFLRTDPGIDLAVQRHGRLRLGRAHGEAGGHRQCSRFETSLQLHG